MSGKERRKVAALAHQLFYAVLGDEEFELPADAPADLRCVLAAAQRVTKEVLAAEDEEHTEMRIEDLAVATFGLLSSPRAFADAIEKAESGARFGSHPEPVLFDVRMLDGSAREMGYGSGTDAIAATLFQIVGIGRRQRGQAKRKRERARNAIAAESHGERAEPLPSDVAASREDSASKERFSENAIVLRGPLAELLYAIRAEGRQ